MRIKVRDKAVLGVIVLGINVFLMEKKNLDSQVSHKHVTNID